MNAVLLMIVIIMIASIVQSTAGFGFSIITMMVLPFYYSVPESIVLKTFSGMAVLGFICVRYRREINLRMLFWPLVLALPGSIMGISGVTSIDNAFAMKILGVGLVLMAAYFYFLAHRIKIPANKWTAMASGGLSGLMGGMLGVPGPPIVLYYSVALPQKESYLVTLQTFLLINDITRMTLISSMMEFSNDLMRMLPIAIGTAVVGVLIGNGIFKRISADALHKIIYIMMGLSGIYYILG